MSPALVCLSLPGPGFPRVSGDEPTLICVMSRRHVFSPRERG